MQASMPIRWGGYSTLLVFLVVVAPGIHATPQYQILDLGGGFGSSGVFVNSGGQAAFSNFANGYGYRGYLFRDTSVTAIGTLGTQINGYGITAPLALNSRGQIAGISHVYDSAGNSLGPRAVLYDGNTLRNLGSLGTAPSGLGSSAGLAINYSGQVVGVSDLYDGNGDFKGQRPFLYDGSSLLNLGTLGTDASGYGSGYARAINDVGQVAGVSDSYDNSGAFLGQRAFLYSGGVLQNLGSLGTDSMGVGDSVALGLNASGQVAGVSTLYDANGNWMGDRAFLYDGTSTRNLGTLGTDSNGYGYSAAFFLNDLGQAAGPSAMFDNAGAYRGQRAVLYSGGEVINLGAVFGTDASGSGSSEVAALNNLGELILAGDQYDAGGNVLGRRTYLYSGGVMFDIMSLLPSNSGWSGLQALSLSDAGYIGGIGNYNGSLRTFIMSPSTVPEPVYFAFLGLGLAGVFSYRYRRV